MLLDEIIKLKNIEILMYIDKKNRIRIQKEWHVRFASGKTLKTGKFSARQWSMWSILEYNDKCIKGTRAIDLYKSQKIEDYYIFDDHFHNCYLCRSDLHIDFSDCNSDIYILPENMEWTMVFTHEQSMELGPYFIFAYD